MAEQDTSRDPKDRRAMLLPSDQEFLVSPTQNPEFFAFLGLNQDYLGFIKKDSLTFFPISQKILASYKGTVPTQLWFGGLDGEKSNLIGYCSLLYYDGRIRGVRQVGTEGASAAQKIEASGSELYDSQRIGQALKELGFSGLEAQLMKQLGRK
jgi:hypothetical protein